MRTSAWPMAIPTNTTPAHGASGTKSSVAGLAVVNPIHDSARMSNTGSDHKRPAATTAPPIASANAGRRIRGEANIEATAMQWRIPK